MKPRHSLVGGLAAIAATFVVFVIPFIFIILMAFKDKQQSSLRDFSWPNGFHLWDNIVQVVQTRNWMLITAFINSSLITVASVTLLIVFAAMVGFVLARRKTRWNGLIEFLILAGL
jgi:raffinose/stachyose/melibiose transport system permease protein